MGEGAEHGKRKKRCSLLLVKQCFLYGMQRRIGTWFCPCSYPPYFAQSVFASARLPLLHIYFSLMMYHVAVASFVVAVVLAAVFVVATFAVLPTFVALPYMVAFVSLLASPLAVAALVVTRPAVREKAPFILQALLASFQAPSGLFTAPSSLGVFDVAIVTRGGG